MKFQPLGDRVLVEPISETETEKGDRTMILRIQRSPVSIYNFKNATGTFLI